MKFYAFVPNVKLDRFQRLYYCICTLIWTPDYHELGGTHDVTTDIPERYGFYYMLCIHGFTVIPTWSLQYELTEARTTIKQPLIMVF